MISSPPAPFIPVGSRSLLLFGIAVNLLVFSLNHIVGIAVNHGDYTPFAVVPQVSAQIYDETQLYVPGPARFFRTGQARPELDVVELRDLPGSYPILHSIVLGTLARATGSVEVGWMLAHALFPTLVWVVLFWNAGRHVGSALHAMAIAWGVCFLAFAPRNFLLLGGDRFLQPLELTRMPQPALAFLGLILAIWLLSRALARPVAARILAAGLSAGALFYLYYYYWIAFFAGAGALALVLGMLSRRGDARTVAAVLGLGCLSGIPFFIWTVQATRAGTQRQLMSRVGAFTRHPDLFGILLASLLFGALSLHCRRQIRDRSAMQPLFTAVVLAIAVGGAVGLNFQLLTGYDAQHGHFYNRVLQPLLMYFFLLMLFRYVRRPAVLAAAAAIAILLGIAAMRQIAVGRNTAASHRQSSPDIDVLLWVRTHSSPDAVVGSKDGNLLTLIPGIAQTWTFVPLGDRSMASTEEILTRYLLLCRMEGRNWPEVEAELRSDSGFQSNASALSYILVMQRKISPEVVATAKAIWDNLDLTRDLGVRRLDYLISARTGAVPLLPAARQPFAALYQNSVWRVFRVPQP